VRRNDGEAGGDTLAFEDIADDWHCEFEDQCECPVYQPSVTDASFRRFGPTGGCGLALVDFEKIAGLPGWGVDHKDARETRRRYDKYFRELRQDVEEVEEEHNDPEWEGYVDYAANTPPKLNLALFRKTAPFCDESDWSGLEKDYVSFHEADIARRELQKYTKSKGVIEHYRGF
jgi:hypothetical protein